MDNQTISIVIPVFKAEATINRCVDSLLRQTWPNWELILVDDGSPDRSGEICDRLAAGDSRIRVFHTPNHGAGSARNFGLDHCNTKWVTFIDADDDIEPGYLGNFHIEEYVHETYSIIIQGYRRVNEHKESLGECIDLHSADYCGHNCVEQAFSKDKVFEYGQVVGKLYDLLAIRENNIRFTTEFHLSEDHLFYLTYLLRTKAIHTYSGTLYNYIWTEGVTGLSRQLHPADEMYIRYDKILKVCEALKSQCHITSESVIRKIDYFSVTGSVALLLGCIYKNRLPASERRNFLKRLAADRKILKKSFLPKSLSGKGLRAVLLHAPCRLKDNLFRLFLTK